MTRLFIPPLGFEITLTEDWTFKLFDEHRNQSLLKSAGLECPRLDRDFHNLSRANQAEFVAKKGWFYAGNFLEDHYVDVNEFYTNMTLRAGTKLKIARVYIRLGQDYFNSITFTCPLLVSKPGDPLFRASRGKGMRFWVKLEDANKIEFTESSELLV